MRQVIIGTLIAPLLLCCSSGGNDESFVEPGNGDGKIPPPSTGPCAAQGEVPQNGFTEIVSKELFNQMFPCARRHDLYTYEGLAQAASVYPTFVNEGTIDDRKREAAAFLANVARETGMLVYAEQIVKDTYCSHASWVPAAYRGCDLNEPDEKKWYYGRGSLQLSWNYNYGYAGEGIGVGSKLYEQPHLVGEDPELAWATGLWFWMTSEGAGGLNKSAHQVMVENGGFGNTIRIINGSVECNQPEVPDGVTERVRHYLNFTTKLEVEPGGDLEC